MTAQATKQRRKSERKSAREEAKTERKEKIAGPAPVVAARRRSPPALRYTAALSRGLALHELATNASKYGALSCENGCVDIQWELTAEGLARIEWQERGGPSVPEQRKRGFGTDLIEKIVAHELRHPVELIFDPEGVRCTLMVPVRTRGDFEIRASRHLSTSS